MPRYIDADEAKSDIKANDWSNPCIPTVVGIILDKIPTADVEERKRGKWIVEVFAITMCKKVYCSVCGYSETKGPAWEENWGLHNFCPNCGADMRRGEK